MIEKETSKDKLTFKSAGFTSTLTMHLEKHPWPWSDAANNDRLISHLYNVWANSGLRRNIIICHFCESVSDHRGLNACGCACICVSVCVCVCLCVCWGLHVLVYPRSICRNKRCSTIIKRALDHRSVGTFWISEHRGVGIQRCPDTGMSEHRCKPKCTLKYVSKQTDIT